MVKSMEDLPRNHTLSSVPAPAQFTAAGQETTAPLPPEWLRPFAWLPIPVLLVAIGILWAADLPGSYESPFLLMALNLLFSTLVSGFIAYLVGRSFLVRGAPGLLMLGCGVVTWGAAGLVGVAAAGHFGINILVTVHNTCVWLSALCHMAGALVSLRPRRAMHVASLWLAAAYTVALGCVGLVTLPAIMGWTPTFFVQGQGGTPLRYLVLGSGTAMFVLTAVLLKGGNRRGNRRPLSAFLYWYTLALGLIAVGLLGVMIESVHGGPLSWTGRAAQFLGGAYMLIAAILAVRETTTWEVSLPTLDEPWRENAFLAGLRQQSPLGWVARYGLAVGAVATAFGLWQALTAWFGPGLPPFITFYPAVMVVALLAGFGPGLLATTVTDGIVAYWIMPPVGHFSIDAPVDRLALVMFGGIGVLMSVVAELYRRSRDKAAAYDREMLLRESREALRRQAELIDPVRAKIIAREMQRVVRERGGEGAAPAQPTGETLRHAPAVVGAAVAGVGLLVLIGWVFGWEPLKSVLPGLATMKANTALCFLLAGLALALRDRRAVRLACAGLVCVVAGMTLAEYVTGGNLGLDQLLFRDAVDAHTIYPGRMVEATALGFLLSSVSLLLLKSRGRAAMWAQQGLAFGAASIGMMAVLGYAYDVQPLYRFAGYASMALHTAASLGLLAAGLLFARSDGLGAVLMTPGPGAQLMRRLLPTVLLVPAMLGWLIGQGLKQGLYGAGMDTALLALLMIASLAAMVSWTALALNRTDRARRETETQLRNLAEVMDNAHEPLIVRELGGVIRVWNRGAETIYGWPAVEALGQRKQVLLRTEGHSIAELDRQLESTGRWEGELIQTTRDGQRLTVESRQTASRIGNGQVFILESSLDITARKRAEEVLRTVSERDSFLVAIADALRSLTDVDEIKTTAARVLGQHLRASRVAYAEVTPEGDVIIERGYVDGAGDIPGRYRLDDYGPKLLRALRAGRNICVADVTNDPSFSEHEKVRYRAVQVVSNLNVPLLKNGRLVALLAVHQIVPRQWTDEEVSLVEETAERTWATVERARAEQALRESERRFRLALHNSPVSVAIQDRNLVYQWAFNQQTRRPDEIVGKTDADLFAPEEVVRINEVKQKVLETGKEAHDQHWVTSNGRRLFLDLSYEPLGNSAGEVTGIGIAVVNLTRQKLAEDALKENEERHRLLADTMLQGVVHQDAEGKIIATNPAAVRILGKTPEQFLGSSSVREEHHTIREDGSQFPGVEHPAMVALRTGQPSRGVVMGVFNPEVDTYRWISIDAVPVFRSGENHPSEVYTVFDDITERKQTEKTLRESESRLRLAQESANVGIWDWTVETGELDFTPELNKLYGLPPGTIKTYQAWRDRVHPDDIGRVESDRDEAIAKHEPFDLEFRGHHSSGGYRWISTKGGAIYDEAGKAIRVFGVNIDITERKRAEEALRASEARYRDLAESIPAMVWATDAQGVTIDHNHRWHDYTGQTPEQACGDGWKAIVHPDDVQRVGERWDQSLRTGEDYSVEYRIRRASDGAYRWHSVQAMLRKDERGKPLGWFGTCFDLTARKQAEAELERMREILAEGQRIAHLGSWEYIAATQETVWSEEQLRIYGLDPAGPSPVYQDMLRNHIHPDDAASLDETFRHCLSDCSVYEQEHRIVRPDGSVRVVHERARPYFDEHGELVKYIGAALDITERTRAEESLKASLNEKEVLLKEIHHRVKNNMQVISSIVSLQADQMQDEAMHAVLQDVTHRVRSMALVHEKLYQSADMARVEFAEYAESLLNYLWRAHGTLASGIRLTLDLEPVPLSVNAAVPCGLLLNELASNALKHAFRGRRHRGEAVVGGQVSVSLRAGPEGRVCLSVRDDGRGLPTGFDWRQANSLGLRLVQVLAGQLHATVEVQSGEGTTFSVSFGATTA